MSEKIVSKVRNNTTITGTDGGNSLIQAELVQDNKGILWNIEYDTNKASLSVFDAKDLPGIEIKQCYTIFSYLANQGYNPVRFLDEGMEISKQVKEAKP